MTRIGVPFGPNSGAVDSVDGQTGDVDLSGAYAGAAATTTALAGKRGKTETIIRMRDFATGDGTDENVAMQAALTDLATAGRPGVLEIDKPPTEYVTSVPLVVPAGVRIFGPGSDVDLIRQSTWAKPVFDLLDKSGVTIEGVGIRYTGDRTLQAIGSFRGSAGKVFGAGIWTNGEYNVFRDVRAEGFVAGIYLSNYNGSTLTGSRLGNVVEGLLVDDVDWGILLVGQSDCYAAVRGSYALSPGSADPPHLVYVSGGTPDAATDNRQITFGPCMAWDGTGGHAYQIKNTTGGKAKSFVARNCDGFINMLKTVDFTVESPVDSGDVVTDDGGAIIIGAGCTDVKIVSPRVTMAVEKRVLTIGGIDNEVTDLSAKVIRSTVTDTAEVSITGTRNRLRNTKCVNSGAGGAIVVLVVSGADNVIDGLEAVNPKKGVQVASGATNTLVQFDPTRIVPASAAGNGSRHVQVLDATTIVRRADNRSARTVTGAGVLSINFIEATRWSHILWTVSTTTGFTIPAPLEPALWMPLTFEIFDNTAGMGTVTWNAIYDLRTAWVNPSAGARRFITFAYDGTAWRETWRSA